MGTDGENLDCLRTRLLEWFRSHARVVVCFSGGVDSSLVLKAAVESLGRERVLAVTASSPALPARELEDAQALAAQLEVKHEILQTNELSSQEYAQNFSDRCFHCRSTFYRALFTLLATSERELNFWADETGRSIVDGTNADDYADIRPGLEAANCFGVRHPLAELGFSKSDVRALSRNLGLSTWDKDEMACLASRLPEGLAVTAKRLKMIEIAENELRALGFKQFRVRLHKLPSPPCRDGDTAEGDPLILARIEISPADFSKLGDEGLRNRIFNSLAELGFSYVTLDLRGYRRGGARPGN